MSRVIFSLIILFFCCHKTEAQEVGIKHYQRKTDSFAFVFPTDPFSAHGLLVYVPDSIYNFGDITIKKANFESFTVKNCLINFQSDTITSIQFSVVGKKNYSKFTQVLQQHVLNYSELEPLSKTPSKQGLQLSETTAINLSSYKKGRKVFIALYTN